METLFELILFAAAAYGIKNYWLSPKIIEDKEVFSSRGATLAKRLTIVQAAQQTEINADSPIQDREESIADNRPSPELGILEPSEIVTASENSALTDKPLTGQAIALQQPEKKPAELVPEDSILKRHFLAHLAAERDAIKNPYPTDSVLRRHYDQRQIVSLNLALQEEAVEILDEVGMNHSAIQSEPETQAKSASLPEDSVLKRHFL